MAASDRPDPERLRALLERQHHASAHQPPAELHSAPGVDPARTYLLEPTPAMRAYDDMTRGVAIVPVPSPIGHPDEAGWSREAEALVRAWGYTTTRRPNWEGESLAHCFDVWPKGGVA